MNVQNALFAILSLLFLDVSLVFSTQLNQKNELISEIKKEHPRFVSQSVPSHTFKLDLTITHLDFHNHQHNSHFFVDKVLAKSWPHLTHLDFSGNTLKNLGPKLHDRFLKKFFDKENHFPKLESLNLSQCDLGDQDIETLSQIYMPALLFLNVCENNLTKLSFLYSTEWKYHLTHLNLSQNNQTFFVESFNGYGSEIYDNSFTTSEIISMLEIMPYLTHLSLNQLQFTFQDPTFFQRLCAIKNQLKLQALNCTHAFVDQQSIYWLEKIIFEASWSFNLTDIQCPIHEHDYLTQFIQKIDMFSLNNRAILSHTPKFEPLWPAYLLASPFSFFSWVQNPFDCVQSFERR